MNNLIKSAALFLTIALSTTNLRAQNDKVPGTDKEGDIVIRKKGDSKEKFVIVIDSNKVTINGKPVLDFKNDNIEISMGDDGPFALAFPKGSFSFSDRGDNENWSGDNFMKQIHSNKAILGVMTKKADNGAKITDVTPESAADKAGLKEGDVITKINDEKIADADDLYKLIGNYKPGDKVNIIYLRDGKESTTSATLGTNKRVEVYNWKNDGDNAFLAPRMPNMRNFSFGWDAKPRMGLQVQDTEDGNGVKVLNVDDESPAGKAGIKENDIITQVNGKDIKSVNDMRENIKDAKDGDSFKLNVLRNNQAQTIDVKFPKDLKTTDL